MEGALRTILNTDWIFISLLVISFLALASRWVFYKNYRAITQGLTSYIQLKDNKIAFSLFYHILFSALISLFVWNFINLPILFKSLSPLYLFGMLWALILLYFILHFLISQLIFLAMNKSEGYKQILSKRTFSLFWIFFPLLFTLLLLYFSFLPQNIIVYIFLTLMLIPTVFEYFYQTNSSNKDNKLSIYYFILYLCTLEILPFLLLLKYGLEWEII